MTRAETARRLHPVAYDRGGMRLSRLHFALGLERAHGLAERMHRLLDLGATMRRRDEAAGCPHDVDAVGHQAHADLARERACAARALELGERHLQRIEIRGVDRIAVRVGIDQESRALTVDAPR